MNRSLDILCINQFFYPDSLGGVERVAHETMTRLVERGHCVDLVGQRTRPGTPDTEIVDGVRVHRYGSAESRSRFGGRTRDALRASRRMLSELASSKRYDVVLPHHYFPYYAYLRSVAKTVTPEIMTFHASYWQELKLEGAERKIAKPLESFLFGRMARRTEVACLSRADRIIVLSDFSAEQLGSYYSFASGKVVKIPGGVDLKRFKPVGDRTAVRRKLGLPDAGAVLFTARRLVPRMGLPNLVEAFAEVHRVWPGATLVIAGTGRLDGELRSLAGELGLREAVRFPGFVSEEELPDYYGAADLFVLPSVAFEGFGMVTLEALACGTPALGTPIGATPEILRPLAPQLIFAGADPASLRRGMHSVLEWLSNEQAAHELRSRCRDYVEERYGWDRAVDSLEGLIEELLAEKGDGRG
ncbi:glycosyltransferase family 4 protein [bacterium]|nr:glycosyltransferase family 4 protein [bacterium]